jgi:4-hydroxy-tetrahydrodipicolinate synthase
LPNSIRGVMPMMVTPFKKNGEVDIEHLRSFTDSLISKGAHGPSMVGSTGEFVHLSEKERILVTEVVIMRSTAESQQYLAWGLDHEGSRQLF